MIISRDILISKFEYGKNKRFSWKFY